MIIPSHITLTFLEFQMFQNYCLVFYINWNTSIQDGDSSLFQGTSRKQYWCLRNAMFAWHQTFGGKLDVSSASKITKTASINWLLMTLVIVFLEFAVIKNIDSIYPLKTTPAAFPQVIQSCLLGRKLSYLRTFKHQLSQDMVIYLNYRGASWLH